MKKLMSIISAITGIAAIIYFIRLFRAGPSSSSPDFPKAAEKKAAEKDVEQTKQELKELETKQYSDAEIEEKFNGK